MSRKLCQLSYTPYWSSWLVGKFFDVFPFTVCIQKLQIALADDVHVSVRYALDVRVCDFLRPFEGLVFKNQDILFHMVSSVASMDCSHQSGPSLIISTSKLLNLTSLTGLFRAFRAASCSAHRIATAFMPPKPASSARGLWLLSG